MAQLAKIETAKVPSTAAVGLKTAVDSKVVPLKTDDASYQYLGLGVLVLVFGIFMAWAAFAPLGSYAVASGKVMVQVIKQVVQHREGGVIEEIFVKDGDWVAKGQQLMLISPIDAQTDKGVILEQLLANLGLEARLDTELEGRGQIVFPPELLDVQHERAKSIMADEQQQFKVRMAAAGAEHSVLKQRIQQLKEQQQGINEQVQAQRELAASYSNEVQELQGLFARQLISKLQLNETERKFLTVKTSIADLEATKAGLKVQIVEAEEQLVLQENNHRKEAAAQLSEARAKIADLRARLDAAVERLGRTSVTAPMAGTVVGMVYNTKGGVVQPGNKILEIVPDADTFEVEAQVSLADIDKVHVGLLADIRFPAFPAASFLKTTSGEVSYVSADTLVDQANGTQYYSAKIKVDPAGVAELAKQDLKLVQGMPAEVSIKAGERTFLDYLLKPLTNMVNHAFNED